MLPLRLLMVALTMPLSSVQVRPLSVMVTGAFTSALATIGVVSAEHNAGTISSGARNQAAASRGKQTFHCSVQSREIWFPLAVNVSRPNQ